MVSLVGLHRPPISRKSVITDCREKMGSQGEIADSQASCLKLRYLLLNRSCWLVVYHGLKGIRSAAKTKSGTPIKAKDSPWDADLTGSVASTVGTKVLAFSTQVNL